MRKTFKVPKFLKITHLALTFLAYGRLYLSEALTTFEVKRLEEHMNHLKTYLEKQPRGSKKQLTMLLGITPTWLSLVLSNSRKPSAELCVQIERATAGAVVRGQLRPDIFGQI